MQINILTLFPEMFAGYFGCSIMKRAVDKGLVAHRLVNIRDFAADRHRTCDDAPYGGGAGMVLKPEPIAAAFDSLPGGGIALMPTPSGRLFDAEKARSLASAEEITLLCGHYEGIDQRIIDLYIDEELSIGDYVLSSGELAAMVIVDALFRHIDGVISAESLKEESHSDGLLEYPHYTRPETFRGMRVPETLLSGHHENIRQWRMRKSREKTEANRPDLLEEGGE